MFSFCLVSEILETNTFYQGRRIFQNLYVSKEEAITGKIAKEQVYDPTNIRLENVSNGGYAGTGGNTQQ